MVKLKDFVSEYVNNLSSSINDSNLKNLELSVKAIFNTIKKNGSIFVCGNGGSAAIANHYVVDFLKFFRERTNLMPKVFSLSNNIETITAISNDINYKKVFSYHSSKLTNLDKKVLKRF